MGSAAQEAIRQLQSLMEEVDEPLRCTYENIHQGYRTETLVRFLKAREWNVPKAYEMLVDCLKWRIENEIDTILANPITPVELYRAVRDSQLIGMSGYSKEGFPVIAIGIGLSTYDKASGSITIVHRRPQLVWDKGDVDVDRCCALLSFILKGNKYVQSHIQMNEYRDRVLLATKKHGRYIGTCIKVLDMTGLKLSALNQIKLLSNISSVDDLNYPEKTETYYIVNPPRIFSACWKVVKPLLQERTRRKIQVLHGCPRDELLKIMDYSSLPHFCRKEGSGSSRGSENGVVDNCFSFDHAFHQQFYNFMKEQALLRESVAPIKHGSFQVAIPDPDPGDVKIARTIESTFNMFGNQNGLVSSLSGLKVNGN